METAELKTVSPPTPPAEVQMRRYQVWLKVLQILILLFIFLVGIRGLGSGFKGLGKDALETFFLTTENPFIGLTIGILGTTLVQSSSVTTSMIVALVAAPENPLPITNAVPMVMGANIGTTVTNTVVSLGHMGRPEEFRRAFGAATCHDFFNFMAVGLLLPLELLTGLLSRPAGLIAENVRTGNVGKLPNPIKDATKAVIGPLDDVLNSALSPKLAAAALIVVSAVLTFGALLALVRTLRVLAASRLQGWLHRALDSSGCIAMAVGVIVTVAAQSSSITTSVLVPLAGAGIVTLEQVFPVTLGANIGTTVTALIASMAVPDETAALAVEIAMVHLLFNLLGTAIIYPLRWTRRIPIRLAERLADMAVHSRKLALAYVVALFYGMPALLVALSTYL
jgi:sodium-dependent phosphate cotransporter